MPAAQPRAQQRWLSKGKPPIDLTETDDVSTSLMTFGEPQNVVGHPPNIRANQSPRTAPF
jgi:hypothetical protein